MNVSINFGKSKKPLIFFSIKKFFKILFTFVLIFSWLFTGWPKIWLNPKIPPEIGNVNAATAPVIESGDVTAFGNNVASYSWAVSTPVYQEGDLLIIHIASDANVTHDWPVTTGGLRPFDITDSGNNTATTSWSVSRPAYNSGDLVVFNIASDANVTHDWPATGPNGETIVSIQDSWGSGSAAERVSAFYYIATNAQAAGSLTVTPSATEQWTATTFRIPVGDFNATTPIDSNGTGGNAASSASVPTPTWSATGSAADGLVVAWMGVDADPVTAIPSGWTQVTSVDRGNVAGTLGVRMSRASASESIASVNWSIAGDTSSTLGYIINTSGSENSGDSTVNIVDSHGSSTAQRVSAFYFVATEDQSAGYIAVTPSTLEQWTAAVVRVPAGEFDPNTPIQATTGTGGSSSGTSATVPSPSWVSSTADGRVVVWLGVDDDPVTGTPAGWTDRSSVDRGAVSGTLSTRDAANTLNETIASANWTIAADSSSTLGYVVNAFPVTISISISDGNVTYGYVAKSGSKTTLSFDMPPDGDMQTITNNSTAAVDLTIKGFDASGGGCTWTLASSVDTDQYTYQFCNETDNDCSSPPTSYTNLSTTDTTLKDSVVIDGTVDFHLRLLMPSDSTCSGEQNVIVTVTASES